MKEMVEESDYSPYCKECTGCGESGCCSPLMCSMEGECSYRLTYLRELKEAYTLLEDFYQHIYGKLPEDLKIEFDKLVDKNFEYWYGKERTNS
jgi:hypothetical protein